MTDRITVDASAWTGRSEYADDLRVSLVPSRRLARWWREHMPRILIPAILIRSGPMEWGYRRGFFLGFGLCMWRDDGDVKWLLSSTLPYGTKS